MVLAPDTNLLAHVGCRLAFHAIAPGFIELGNGQPGCLPSSHNDSVSPVHSQALFELALIGQDPV